MFRKITNRIASAASSVLGIEDPNVQRLVNLGFETSQATAALQATNGDVDQAAELLLAGGTPQTPQASQQESSTEDDMLQRALQESLQQPQPRSAAMNRAAQAAEERAAKQRNKFKKNTYTTTAKPNRPKTPPRSTIPGSQGLAITHPDVKLLPKLQDKTKEEQVLRCTDRLRNYPNAVDTLLRALSAVQNDPNNGKFRSIDTATPVFQRTLQNAPGALDLLGAMNYYTVGEKLILDRSNVDPALLYLGVSALEQAKLSPEYQAEKLKLVFMKEMEQIRLSGDSSETESIERAAFIAKCPTEPPEGRGALVQVDMAGTTVMRRFDADDTLDDILNWIGGHGVVIRDKILMREWSLVDMNRYPSAPIDCTSHIHHTLQYIGLFPSGRLTIAPSTPEWIAGEQTSTPDAASRALASAPTGIVYS